MLNYQRVCDMWFKGGHHGKKIETCTHMCGGQNMIYGIWSSIACHGNPNIMGI
jgi:hypothetical protein